MISQTQSSRSGTPCLTMRAKKRRLRLSGSGTGCLTYWLNLSPYANIGSCPRNPPEGRSIGSGQVEGACKNPIGRRLKQTGARWTFRRVNRMGLLCCLVYSDHWKSYWTAT